MRRFLAVTAALAFGGAARGAPDAVVDELFRAAPAPPADPCGATEAQKDEFRRAAAEFERRVDREVQQRRRATKQVRKRDEARIREEMAARYPGAAAMDRQKLRGMSKAERLAMAQQMMAQQGGLPPAVPVPAGASPGEEALRQRELVEKVSARERQGRARLDALLESESEATAAARRQELAPIEKELDLVAGGTIGSDEEERKGWTAAQRQAWADREAKAARLRQQRQLAADRYCARFGPALRDALAEYRAAVLPLRGEYDRVEQGQAALAGSATGATLTPVEPGLAALEALGRYADALVARDPFRFDVRR